MSILPDKPLLIISEQYLSKKKECIKLSELINKFKSDIDKASSRICNISWQLASYINLIYKSFT